MTDPRPLPRDEVTDVPTTPEARAYHADTQPFAASPNRAALPDDWNQVLFSLNQPPCPFNMSEATKQRLGITAEYGYTYVLNPNSAGGKESLSNRPQEIMDSYPGAEKVYDPETHEQVGIRDTVLMKVPIKYIQKRDEDLVKRTNMMTLANPVLCRELGITEAQSEEIRRQYDARLAEIQGFKARDPDQRALIVQRADAQSRPFRNSYSSPTYHMTLDDAVESKIKQIARSNNLDVRTQKGRAAAEKFYEEKYLPQLQRRAMAQGRQDHRASWVDSLSSARAMNGGPSTIRSFAGFDGFKDAKTILAERQAGSRPLKSTTRQK